MEKSTLKTIAFVAGLILFCVVLSGYLYWDDFSFDLRPVELVMFSILSLFSSALTIYGMKTNDTAIVMKRCKVGGGLGLLIWVFLIICIFSATKIRRGFEDLFYLNWFLLCASASSLIVFALKFSLKKEN